MGVSIVICCHNSAQRLPATLYHLTSQEIKGNIPWEVVIVDNASTDYTTKVAQQCWPTNHSIPLRVVYEPKLGLTHARHRGFIEAKYDIVSFVDDDNWVSPIWVTKVSELMNLHIDVGACGGLNIAATDVELPWWFEQFQRSYAVGPQDDNPGHITWKRSILFGAGLTIRKSAWQGLCKNGFKTLLVDRSGKDLTCGGDYELCLALRLAGWRIWYEPRLQLKHYIPVERLNWEYFRRLLRGVGMSSLGLDPYYFALQNKKMKKLKQRFFIRTWQIQVLISLITLVRYFRKLILSMTYPLEGDADTLLIERSIGRLLALLKQRKKYDITLKKIQIAPWIKVK
ncbi:glycosyltransferase family 2 protein [bacterium]|nr:glycosyltransferase family 2 protein [bacterium]